MQGLLKQPQQMAQPKQPEEALVDAQQPNEAQQEPVAQPEQDDGADDPSLATAIDFVKRALYETGSADSVHATMKVSRQPAEDMALIAYELTSIADEKTEGQVPDELLMTLAASVLSEVAEIAEASGVKLQPSDVASALKIMTLRFLGEMGHDTRELQAAFDQVSPEQVNQIAMEAGDV
ncbi:MAG: hypothetical protein Q8L60_10590 [Gammaproteobacteria bacterium]|nr:hypothetical protein [Gammaproteobacteria bacterium]MDP2346795.1 hypothetical protein [Gammaproteobacteria bacterium]